MKLSLDLVASTKPQWVETVMSDFPSFLQDHADCERKASAMAMSFVAKYPDRIEIIPELIETGIEELEHFQQVYAHMAKRGIRLAKDMQQDSYITALIISATPIRLTASSTGCCSRQSSSAAGRSGFASCATRLRRTTS